MKKFLLLLIIIAAVAGGIYYRQQQQAKAKEAAPKPKIVKVERGSIVAVVDTTGKVVSNRDVEIKCKASGQVVKLPFEVSDQVKEGELLVELDPIDEQRAVQQAEVTLAASKAKEAQARQNLSIAEVRLAVAKKKTAADLKSAQARATDTSAKVKRLSELLRTNLASKEDFESSEVNAIEAAASLDRAKISIEELQAEEMTLENKRQDIHLAESQVKSDEIDLSKAKQRLSDTKVFAPVDGILSERKVQIGQIISSGISNVGGGTSILTISDLSRIFVVASVDESDIGQVQVEQNAVITTDAFPDAHFRGKVVLISTKGMSTANVVTFEVKIEVLGHNKSLLKPEMTANIKIITANKEDALVLPAEAVYLKSGDRNPLAAISDQDAGRRMDGRREGRGRNRGEDRQPANQEGNVQNDATTDVAKQGDTQVKSDAPEARKDGRKGQRYRPRRNFVLIMKDGKNEEREVVAGITDGTRTEIVSGLQENDEVIIEKGMTQSRWQNDMGMMRARRIMGGGKGGN